MNHDHQDAASRAHGIASLIEQTARHVTGLCWAEDLQAAQWSALRYFAMAGTKARNVVGLAKFQGINPGTASRTIGGLARKDFITVSIDPRDRRSRIISLTQKGNDLLARDPLHVVEEAVAAMPTSQREGLANGLRALLDHLHGVAGVNRADFGITDPGPADALNDGAEDGALPGIDSDIGSRRSMERAGDIA